MNRKTWLESHKTIVSERDYRLLDKASKLLVHNIMPHEEETLWKPYRAIGPALGYFFGIWNWDSAFIATAVARFDPILAREQAEAFFLFQKEDGLLPDCILTPDRGNRVVDMYSKPPVWPWAIEVLDRRAPDDEFLKKMYPKLVKNEQWWRTQRFNEADGLFFYNASTQGEKRDDHIRWESGLDNSVRFDDGVLEYLYPIDENCFMVTFYRSMQYLALRQGLVADAEEYAAKEKALTDVILNKLWSEEDQCFWDYNFRDNDFVRVLTPAAFMPLWIHIATPTQAAALAKLAADETKLYPSMPSVSFDNPKFSLKGYWRGPVWMNIAYFAAKGLYDYGFRTVAMGIRDTLLDWMDKDETIHENYVATTGAPNCNPDFSWSAVFAIEFILEMK